MWFLTLISFLTFTFQIQHVSSLEISPELLGDGILILITGYVQYNLTDVNMNPVFIDSGSAVYVQYSTALCQWLRETANLIARSVRNCSVDYFDRTPLIAHLSAIIAAPDANEDTRLTVQNTMKTALEKFPKPSIFVKNIKITSYAPINSVDIAITKNTELQQEITWRDKNQLCEIRYDVIYPLAETTNILKQGSCFTYILITNLQTNTEYKYVIVSSPITNPNMQLYSKPSIGFKTPPTVLEPGAIVGVIIASIGIISAIIICICCLSYWMCKSFNWKIEYYCCCCFPWRHNTSEDPTSSYEHVYKRDFSDGSEASTPKQLKSY